MRGHPVRVATLGALLVFSIAATLLARSLAGVHDELVAVADDPAAGPRLLAVFVLLRVDLLAPVVAGATFAGAFASTRACRSALTGVALSLLFASAPSSATLVALLATPAPPRIGLTLALLAGFFARRHREGAASVVLAAAVATTSLASLRLSGWTPSCMCATTAVLVLYSLRGEARGPRVPAVALAVVALALGVGVAAASAAERWARDIAPTRALRDAKRPSGFDVTRRRVEAILDVVRAGFAERSADVPGADGRRWPVSPYAVPGATARPLPGTAEEALDRPDCFLLPPVGEPRLERWRAVPLDALPASAGFADDLSIHDDAIRDALEARDGAGTFFHVVAVRRARSGEDASVPLDGALEVQILLWDERPRGVRRAAQVFATEVLR